MRAGSRLHHASVYLRASCSICFRSCAIASRATVTLAARRGNVRPRECVGIHPEHSVGSSSMPEMLRAQYERRGPVPQDVIDADRFDVPPLAGRAGSIGGRSRRRSTPRTWAHADRRVRRSAAAACDRGPRGVGRIAGLGPVPGPGLAVGQLVLLPRGAGTLVYSRRPRGTATCRFPRGGPTAAVR